MMPNSGNVMAFLRVCRRLIWLAPLLFAPVSGAGESRSDVFESSILPIFESRCLTCHGDSAPQAELDLRTAASILKGGKSGPAVIAGSVDRSLLLDKVVSGTMPPGDDALSREEIGAIRGWIDRLGQAHAALASGGISEKDVLPIFLMRCVVCHGKRAQEGGLDLRTQAGRLRGGKSGPALVPGNPEASLLFQRIVREEMPPEHLLFKYRVRPPSTEEVETLRRWIAAGALADPPLDPSREADLGLTEGDRRFWSFQTPERPPVPTVTHGNLVRNPIDAFLLEKLEAHGLSFSPEADRLTLMRRAYLNLIGMPPTAAQARAYLKDGSPDAYERMIEDLLSSPHYGERWAQHWLDVAGYADTEGIKHADHFRPQAWRYRDYVIRSLNQDKPYDRFLLEQLAGDELVDYKKEVTPAVLESLAATGFLRLASDPTDSPTNASLAEKMDVIHDEIQVLGSSVLGLTMGCARCHDHKYDPISQQDYYRLSAIFQSAYDPYDWLDPTQRYLKVGDPQEIKETERHNAPIRKQIDDLERAWKAKTEPLRNQILESRLAALPEALRRDLRTLLKTPEEERNSVQKYLQRRFRKTLKVSDQALPLEDDQFKAPLDEYNKALADLKKKLRAKPAIRALFDMGGEGSPAYVLRRGNAETIGERVYPGVPSVLRANLPEYKPELPSERTDTTGTRLALARWLVHPDHPLTSRVLVNRVWMHHFGRGIVATPADFGRTGARPSHPELLDWLATWFVDQDWSLKSLHRLMMTSTAYRQNSRQGPEGGADPEGHLWSRMSLRRMEAEVLYDSMLHAAGRLDPDRFGPAEPVEKMSDGEVVARGSKKGWRRAIYTEKRRLTRMTFLDLFDAPQMAPNCTERISSNVAPQALQLMNGYLTRKLSRHLAGRLVDAHPDRAEDQIRELYLRVLSREPTPEEIRMSLDSLSELAEQWTHHLENENDETPRRTTAHWSALASVSHALLTSAEFSYID